MSGITDTAYTVNRLLGESYVFRVVALNKAGHSKPSEESDILYLRKVVVQDAPIIQEKLTDTIVNRNTTLILSCIISGIPEPTIEWFKDDQVFSRGTNTYSSRVAKLVIENTQEHEEGFYKCVATNVCGSSETNCSVKIREEPNIIVDERLISQKLRIDDVYEVIASISGYPRPKLIWYKSKTKLEAKSNTKMTYEDKRASLIINKLKRAHTGKYVLEASNDHGVSRKELVLTIIDKPSPPEGPLVVKNLKKDAVSLEWKPPRDCGGLELSQYVLERYCKDQNTWMKVADLSKDTLSHIVHKLKPNSQHKFRVAARNAIGDSEPLESELVTIRLIMEVPSPPRGPVQISGMTMESFVISWLKSDSDGGSAITEYLVDLKKSTDSKWDHRGATSSEVTHLALLDLSRSTGYDVRIYARNAVGDSLYLQSEESIMTGRQPSKYSTTQISIFCRHIFLLTRLLTKCFIRYYNIAYSK